MARTKKAPKAQIPPSKTSHLFGPRKNQNDRGAAITSERIASDLAAFRKAGGRIEVLGMTRTLTRIDAGKEQAPPALPVNAPPRTRR